ncbi:uncharacterized protein FOMMEDRAFT_159198 [Fomitiporia mediterranea MF3/22]|uniref:uncharacterized protein n=1 Tax=Fomitiporia mediterranea (strain MF3/22) TaxID=694068 RepID=UPI0004407D12|nr:uncharacterized protein FOMMEDRAFT_159198 [Fomitiporia mediterranea MF3/22]EJD00495.1 hypothetical protein FOMMEDRAFT_159198 [Fomitiporia mediterranea MF3/22]
MALKSRFVQRKQLEDIEEAILHHRAALELRPYGHTKRCISLSHLAAALYDYFDEAVSLLQEAVALEPVGQPHRPDTLNRLARCFLYRFKSLGQKDDLNKATSRARNALDLCPKDHPHCSELLRTLAESLHIRFQKEHGEGNLEKSMYLFKRAATHKFSGTLLRLHAAHHWAVAAHTNNHHSTLSAYHEATSLLQHALTISPTLEMQHEFLTTDYTNGMLVLNAAAYAIKIGELEKAVEFLEQGRALLWSQMRSFRGPLDRLAEVDKPLAENFADVSRRLETLATVSPTRSPGLEETIVKTESDHVPKAQRLVDEMLKLRRQLSLEQEKLINKIRQLPGFLDFLSARPFKTLKQAANEDALIILPSDDPPIVCVPLKDSFREKATRLYKDLVLQALWDLVVSKIVKQLKELGFGEGTRIWWCTTSILSALPFHAAGPFEGPDGCKKYLVDEYVSSYTPTLTALIEARTVSRKGKTKLLIIGDTSLASAWEEIETIRKYRMRSKELITNEATRDAVIESLRDTKWVHFTCHGHLDSKPLDSSFKLHDGRLSLLDIVKAHLPNAEFAFLSACHTVEQHYEGAQDEVLHLSAAMQFCGFRSVIGSMWELYDPDGPRFAKVIYQHMNMGPKSEAKYKRAAGALREAVLELEERQDATTENWVNLVHIGA